MDELELGKFYLRSKTMQKHLFFIPYKIDKVGEFDYQGKTINPLNNFDTWLSDIDADEVVEVTEREDMIYVMFIENKLKYKWKN